MRATRKTTPKIPKGFVLVNLSEAEQKELRDLSREIGVTLRDCIKWALYKILADLRSQARIQRQTGLRACDQYQFFNDRKGHN